MEAKGDRGVILPCKGFNVLWRRDRGAEEPQHLQFGILTMGLVVVQPGSLGVTVAQELHDGSD